MRTLAPLEEVVERTPACSADEGGQVLERTPACSADEGGQASATRISGAPSLRNGKAPKLTERLGRSRGTIDDNAYEAGCIDTADAVRQLAPQPDGTPKVGPADCPAPHCHHACDNGDGDGESGGCATGAGTPIGTVDALCKSTAARGGCEEPRERLMPVLLPHLPELSHQLVQASRKLARSAESDAAPAATPPGEPRPDDPAEEPVPAPGPCPQGSQAVRLRHSAKGAEGLHRPGICPRSSMESVGACHRPGLPPERWAASRGPAASAAAGGGAWLLGPRPRAPTLSIACLALAVLLLFLLGQPAMESVDPWSES